MANLDGSTYPSPSLGPLLNGACLEKVVQCHTTVFSVAGGSRIARDGPSAPTLGHFLPLQSGPGGRAVASWEASAADAMKKNGNFLIDLFLPAKP